MAGPSLAGLRAGSPLAAAWEGTDQEDRLQEGMRLEGRSLEDRRLEGSQRVGNLRKVVIGCLETY